MPFLLQFVHAKKTLLFLIAALLAANAVIYVHARQHAPLTISFLAVGDGEAVLVRPPTGSTLLINTGPDASILRELGSALPFWHRSINALITLDSTKSVTGGLTDVLGRYRVSQVFSSDPAADIQSLQMRRGQRFDLGAGVYADVLYAGDDVALLKIAYGATIFLFTGALSPSIRTYVETMYANDGSLHADVVTVPHQGATDSLDEAWLAAVAPRFAVISVGADNRYGYPATSTLERLQSAGAELVRTDRDGRIVFISDGVTVSRK